MEFKSQMFLHLLCNPIIHFRVYIDVTLVSPRVLFFLGFYFPFLIILVLPIRPLPQVQCSFSSSAPTTPLPSLILSSLSLPSGCVIGFSLSFSEIL